ncbi:MAG: hypothetical protein CTY18_08565 [Methylomonas sp.]|nr:MAG: hypothetical protein CTY24_04445 [Methylobacter sp.]PPD34334.1 MAG: hypothetical protein CTY18_08565 [Methylomonas sp.]
MKIITIKNAGLLVTLLFTALCANAYEDKKPEEICKKPKFRDFSLAEYKAPEKKEVPPESEFTFTLPATTNPETIKLSAKGKNIPFSVKSNSSIHRITAKLPAEFNGDYVRINVRAEAFLGCYENAGWLVKVSAP